jgi:hypothetical protein
MSTTCCVQCRRDLEPGELQHLHMTRFFSGAEPPFWTHFPTTRMLRQFEEWLRQTQQVQLFNDALPFLPPAVVAQERLVEATEALRLALGLPHVRSLLDLLDAVLVRLREDAA